ncbi:hypothetical protein OEZ86_013897 [Tetradesmus obliquus]|nr:hypothetical protein OEZ86_013897 [Tetradesmus obliquus]
MKLTTGIVASIEHLIDFVVELFASCNKWGGPNTAISSLLVARQLAESELLHYLAHYCNTGAQRLQQLALDLASAEQQQQQQRSRMEEYANLYRAGMLLQRIYLAVYEAWPGKLLAGNTIAACFKPAMLLLSELSRGGITVAIRPPSRHGNASSSSSGSSSSSVGSCDEDTLRSTTIAMITWIRLLAERLHANIAGQQV